MKYVCVFSVINSYNEWKEGGVTQENSRFNTIRVTCDPSSLVSQNQRLQCVNNLMTFVQNIVVQHLDSVLIYCRLCCLDLME